MNIIQPEPVTRVYCDNCGKEATGVRYGLNGKDIGSCCSYLWHKAILRSRVIGDIKDQPFY